MEKQLLDMITRLTSGQMDVNEAIVVCTGLICMTVIAAVFINKIL